VTRLPATEGTIKGIFEAAGEFSDGRGLGAMNANRAGDLMQNHGVPGISTPTPRCSQRQVAEIAEKEMRKPIGQELDSFLGH